MWITLVEKAVDNVENLDLSTGISAVNGLFTIRKKAVYSSAYFVSRLSSLCVTSLFYVAFPT